MNPIHIVCNKDKIAPRVLLPGDPLRAKYIAEKYLEKAELINDVRNMLGYTGIYKGKKVTVIGSGMGIPSASLYAYELFKFYNVKKLIRIGSAGALNENIKVRDIVLGTYAFSHSNFRYALTKNKSKNIASSNNLNLLASEMEAFGIYTVANFLKKDATCLVSISDSKFEPENNLTPEERQQTLDEMIVLALKSIIR